jgi:hypothetical protein
MSNPVTVRVIQLGQTPRDMTVEAGTTLADLAAQLGVPGAEHISALDATMEPIGPNHAITPETGVVNLCYKLAGA